MLCRRSFGEDVRHACLLVGERFRRLQGRGQPFGLEGLRNVGGERHDAAWRAWPRMK